MPTRAAAKKLHVVRIDLNLASGLAVLFPSILVQLAFDGDLLSLNQVLIDRFPAPSPKDDVEEIRFIYPLLALLSALVDRYGKFTNGHTAGGILQLRVAGESSDQYYVVYICHTVLLFAG